MREYHDPEIKILLCDYRETIESWNHENVFNSWWYLYWNNCSGAVVETEKATYSLEPDKVCLIAPETVFSTRLESSFNHFYIHFTVGAPFDQIKSRIYLFSDDEVFLKQLKMLQSFSINRAKHMLQMSLLSHSVISSSLLRVNFNDIKRLKKYDARIEKTLKFLNKNLSLLYSNESLAENVGMSVNGFIRLFMSELGITPQKYSRRKRIEKASILLHFTDKKIDKIANETGFLDRYHFSRAFKETTNYSPAEFRKRRILL